MDKHGRFSRGHLNLGDFFGTEERVPEGRPTWRLLLTNARRLQRIFRLDNQIPRPMKPVDSMKDDTAAVVHPFRPQNARGDDRPLGR